MKNFVCILIISLMCVSLFSACNLEKDKSVTKDIAMGRYIETDLKIPDEIGEQMIIYQKSNKDLEIWGYDEAQNLLVFTSKDGLSWDKKDIPWLESFKSKYISDYQGVAFENNNEYYIVDYNSSNKLIKIKENNTFEEIPIQWKNKPNDKTYMMDVRILPNGDFLFALMYEELDYITSVERYNSNGDFVMSYDGKYNKCVLYDNKLVQIDEDRRNIIVYDIESGNIDRTIAYDNFSIQGNYNTLLSVNSEGAIYLADLTGIQRLAPDGSLWETVAEGNITSFGMPSLIPTNFIADKNDEFLCLFLNSSKKNLLKRYVYSADTPTVPTKEIFIYSLYESNTIKQLAGEYQKAHPETKVTINIGITKDSSATKTDVIRALNTELLAGKGADLILLDNLPVQSYIEKGVLLDMSTIDVKDLNPSIINAYKSDGKMYSIPLRYLIPTLWGNVDILNSSKTFEDLAQWATANPDKEVFTSFLSPQLISIFYGSCSPNWIKDNYIDKEKLSKFLEAVKVLGVKDENSLNDEEFYVRFINKDIGLLPLELNGFSDLMIPSECIKQRGDSMYSLTTEAGVFMPQIILGINANSTNIEIAKEIVQLGLSETIQGTDLRDGFPINDKSFQKGLEGKNSSTVAVAITYGDGTLTAEWPEQKYIDRLSELSKQLKVPSSTDETLMELIIEESEGFFNDEKTVDEVTEAIIKRAESYFAE